MEQVFNPHFQGKDVLKTNSLIILLFLVSKGKRPVAHYGCANMNGSICKSWIDITYLEWFSRLSHIAWSTIVA